MPTLPPYGFKKRLLLELEATIKLPLGFPIGPANVDVPPPVTANAVVVIAENVALTPITFCRLVFPRTVKVEVTVELAATNPPNKLSVEVALDPRAVTVARVSVSAKRYAGQLVPVDRHTVLPFTKRLVVETTPEA
jgi:hypothetical protein